MAVPGDVLEPESWSVRLDGENGSEGQSFLIAEGRSTGRLSARYRGANFPRRRTDGTLTPDFRGVLEADDGPVILITWSGFARSGADGVHELVGRLTHVTDDTRYTWLNDRQYAVGGEVRPKAGGDGFDVVIEVAELVWEPLSQSDTDSAGWVPAERAPIPAPPV